MTEPNNTPIIKPEIVAPGERECAQPPYRASVFNEICQASLLRETLISWWLT